jgi:hypothetical protein
MTQRVKLTHDMSLALVIWRGQEYGITSMIYARLSIDRKKRVLLWLIAIYVINCHGYDKGKKIWWFLIHIHQQYVHIVRKHSNPMIVK